MKINPLLLIIITFSLCAGSCYTRRSEPFRGQLDRRTASIQQGEQLFNQHCYKCHPSGEYGLGLGVNTVPVPRFVLAFQIRHGLGVMPAFKKNELSNQEVRAITGYMKALKRNSKEKNGDVVSKK